MITGNRKFFGLVALMACALGSQAFAQTQDCIVVKTKGETEKEVVNDKGEKTRVLVPIGKVIPGTEVIWTMTANNVCKVPSDKVVINDPVPEHMTYVPNSAFGAGSDISFSVDGQKFSPAGQLTVVENGVTRPARAEEYRHIRWEFKSSLQPGASATARFRAVLN